MCRILCTAQYQGTFGITDSHVKIQCLVGVGLYDQSRSLSTSRHQNRNHYELQVLEGKYSYVNKLMFQKFCLVGSVANGFISICNI
jgi:hypothetical protein